MLKQVKEDTACQTLDTGTTSGAYTPSEDDAALSFGSISLMGVKPVQELFC